MKKSQKLKHQSESEESDSDDECLQDIARKKKRACRVAEKYRINVDNPLCDIGHEACEFCDRTFSSRLQSLVHNSRHIIIPLIKCDTPQPRHHKERSRSPIKELPKFNNNKIILGKKKMNNKTSIKNRTVFDDDDSDVIVLSDTDSGEENMSNGKSKDLPKLKPDNSRNILDSFVSDCRVILDDTVSRISTVEPDDDSNVNVHRNNDYGYIGNNINNQHVIEKTTVLNAKKNLKETDSIDKIEDTGACSVHNDELVKLALHFCEFCRGAFPNRYKYIEHKTRHLRVRMARPDACVVCESLPRRLPSVMCAHCTQTHGRHYEMEDDEPAIDNNFAINHKLELPKETLNQHSLEKRLHVKYLRLCGICAVFQLRRTKTLYQKNRYNNERYKYTQILNTVVLEINDISAENVCENCGNAFSEGKIVERKHINVFKHDEDVKTSMMSKLQFEEDSPIYKPRKTNSLSNVQRLSRIKKRFKKIKKINQC